MAAVERHASVGGGGGGEVAVPRGGGAAPGGAVRALLLLLLAAVALPACHGAPARPSLGKRGWAERLQALSPGEVGDLGVYRARG